ncbi:phosphate starvation-inducible protein PhoH [Andreprevotia lacus DSM 23236]|uniref:PhoH-like protein n=1 Tax=Andreprevotia lacus DSM 23236 TaxID=1121001 RepID=A0A1W1X1X4_9NEIS|nr:PhoH family protein [Andreprevotia lacus]SMC17738.1 phosphate starvation-inducible protein PhoH [Andreprevotia lacus DSM 23236]
MISDTISFLPADNTRLANLCGPLDENLKQIETALDVGIARRDANFRISGKPRQIKLALDALEYFYNEALLPLDIDYIQLGLVELTRSPDDMEIDPDAPVLKTRRSDLRGRTPRQTEYIKAVQAHDITFGIGPAGTGKTYLAVACAVDALERDVVKRLVLVRPAVEAGEKLGFLPGDLVQKVDPYLRPLYDALYDLMGVDKVTKLFEKGIIEIAPLAFMRGRTLNHAFVILDEAQNTSPEQMKMFLTRIGFGSKAVITGDPTQIDLPKHQKSGLIDAQEVLDGIRGIALHYFTSADVVRHPLVQKIVDAYDRKGKEREAQAAQKKAERDAARAGEGEQA